jgi:hypothetical protein
MIKSQLPNLEKLIDKNKISVDIAKIPFADNAIVRYQEKYSKLSTTFLEPLRCGIDPCQELYKFMLYRNSSTQLIILNQSPLSCNYEGAHFKVSNYLELDDMINKILGKKKERSSNREVVIFMSRSELKVLPELNITANGLDIDEVSLYIGESLSLEANCAETNAKFAWRPIRSASPVISFLPKETGYHHVEAKIGSCDLLKDSILVTIKECENVQKIKSIWNDTKLYSPHPTNKVIKFFYRSTIAEDKSFVLVTSSSCQFQAYKVQVLNVDRNSIILDKNYSMRDIKESCALNISGGEHDGKFVFSLRAAEDQGSYDFNYENTFQLTLTGIELNGEEELILNELIQFSPCP